ncbi:immunoglobulin-like domain-containing protein [Chryseobacterium sp.]|uniref:immunoglobulin-like domain-containing protein n=1 Tax=Chryseobacterium sp. TaxID=1871047 RepID=UPI0011C993D4|nr:immunoglobulin-like domain-containing protein [Chryseobacterium sp.]TXF77360.1 DUF5011 domain-containing protein [Chryseobacterium sp.]
MKIKNIIKIAAINASALIFAVSCSSDSDTFGLSDVTNYPVLEVLGNSPAFVQLGGSYTDPGVKATENGVVIPFETSYQGDYRGANTLNLNVADRYTAVYSAVNKDGFSATANRSIYVYKTGDFLTSIEGLYESKVVRTPSQGAVPANIPLKYVIIWKNTDGTYEVSDAIGGYYDLGRSYGTTYASRGLKLNYTAGIATVASQPNGVGVFGGNVMVSNVTVNATTKTIVIPSTWDSGYNFTATLTQIN